MLCMVASAPLSSTVASNSLKDRRPFASQVGSAFFLVIALYSLAFVGLFDVYCLPLYVTAASSVIAAAGIHQMKRWGLWTALASAPIVGVAFMYAFSASGAFASVQGYEGGLFRLSLLGMLIVECLIVLSLVDKRREFN